MGPARAAADRVPLHRRRAREGYSFYEIKVLPEERDMSKLIRVIKENVLSNQDEPLLGE